MAPRAALIGLAAALTGAVPALDAHARGVPAGPGLVRPGPFGGGLHRPHLGPRFGPFHRRPFARYPFAGYGYGIPFGYYPPLGYGYAAPADPGPALVDDALLRRAVVPEALGIRPQPVGVPTLTVISRDPRTGRNRAVVYELGAGTTPPGGSGHGPRILRVRGGR